MDVQLKMPFEVLVDLVEQLPESQKQALIRRLQSHHQEQPITAAEKIARLESMVIDSEVIEVPSVHREDWYDDDGR